jgi:hypothetical protein
VKGDVGMKYQRRKNSMREKWTCHFVGESQEDLRNILKRQLVRHINEQNTVPVISLKSDLNKEYSTEINYKNKKA